MSKQPQPAPPSNVKRVAVDRLTPTEKEGLEQQGFDLSQEFVDIDVREQQMVDAKAEERSKAAKDMAAPAYETVVDKESEEKPKTEEVKVLQDRIKELEGQIAGHNTHCPRCSWPVDTKVEHQPTDEDIQSFLESVCAGDLFYKEYDIYGGRLKVKFRTRYSCEMDAIREHVTSESHGVMGDDLLMLTDELVFLASLDSLENNGRVHKFSSLKDLLVQREKQIEAGNRVKDVAAILHERTADVPSHIRIVIKQLYIEFSTIVEHLMVKATDPKYWEGTST